MVYINEYLPKLDIDMPYILKDKYTNKFKGEIVWERDLEKNQRWAFEYLYIYSLLNELLLWIM